MMAQTRILLPMRFSKMEGLGNDYVYVDARHEQLPEDLPALARAVSDRHRGIGADGLILVAPPESPQHHARMRMWNADGSSSAMCGNGLRCAALLAHLHGHAPARGMLIETDAGLREVHLGQRAADGSYWVDADMGEPLLVPAAVPVHSSSPGPLLRVQAGLPSGTQVEVICVGMGNPHAVYFVHNAESAPVAELGPQLEHHPVFPARTNVEFVSPLADGAWRQRTWERGSGITQACGSGACAVAVAVILTQRAKGPELTIRLDGGDLHIRWEGLGQRVRMRGPARLVFTGTWPWN